MRTMKAITEALEVMTSGSHLPMPETVIVGHGHVTLIPELPGAPITGLLLWAMHLDGPVEYTAEVMFVGEPSTTFVKATGKIDDIDVAITASTYRPLRALVSHPRREAVRVHEMDLRELASEEAVITPEVA